MNATQYRDALKSLGLSQACASRLFGVGERTSRRWASGEQDIPRAVGIALILMRSHGENPDWWIKNYV